MWLPLPSTDSLTGRKWGKAFSFCVIRSHRGEDGFFFSGLCYVWFCRRQSELHTLECGVVNNFFLPRAWHCGAQREAPLYYYHTRGKQTSPCWRVMTSNVKTPNPSIQSLTQSQSSLPCLHPGSFFPLGPWSWVFNFSSSREDFTEHGRSCMALSFLWMKKYHLHANFIFIMSQSGRHSSPHFMHE